MGGEQGGGTLSFFNSIPEAVKGTLLSRKRKFNRPISSNIEILYFKHVSFHKVTFSCCTKRTLTAGLNASIVFLL